MLAFVLDRVAVGSTRGFQLYDLSTETWSPLPDFRGHTRENPLFAGLAKQLEGARPLGIYALPEKRFLLCYDRVACYVDERCVPEHVELVFEWESNVERTACMRGYVLGFSASQIEVRNARTGLIVQVLEGDDFRLLDNSELDIDTYTSVLYAAVQHEARAYCVHELVLGNECVH